MSVVSNGQELTPSALRALVLMGGDTSALVAAGSEDDPATRGAHLIVRYQATLGRFYEDWHGRAVHALNNYATARRNMLMTQSATVAAAMGESNGYVSYAWSFVQDNLSVHNRAAGMPLGLPGAAGRQAHYAAGARVAAATITAAHGAERHKVDHGDVHTLQYTVHDILAAQGMTSAELLGNAIDFQGQITEVRGATRAYMRQVAEYQSEEAQAAASSKAARRSGIASMSGMATNVIGGFLK